MRRVCRYVSGCAGEGVDVFVIFLFVSLWVLWVFVGTGAESVRRTATFDRQRNLLGICNCGGRYSGQ